MAVRLTNCAQLVHCFKMTDKTTSELVIGSLQGQYQAALSTLEQCIVDSDADTWTADHLDGPVNRVVFHTLIFTDVYLDWGEDRFRTQEFHIENPQLFQDYEELLDREPRNTYDKDDCVSYLSHCRLKVRQSLPNESIDILIGDSGFPSRQFSRLALHIYNIRHIQHHAAQLGLRRQLAEGSELRWVSVD